MDDKSPNHAFSGGNMNELMAPVQAQMARQADTDAEVIGLWLHGRSPHTQRAYTHDIGRFVAFVARPLAQVKLRDLQAFSDSLVGLADGSRARCLAAVKSLLTFAQKIGYIAFNVGAALELPASKDTLAERILPEADVLAMIRGEVKPRNHALLRLLYVSGVRVSEVCGLAWRDVQPVGDDTAQITVYGKGGKTRAVRLTPSCWRALEAIRGAAGPEGPVFRSQKGGHLDPSQVARIVRAAAVRAGVSLAVSPHWMRHAHASHALDRGAPISLVQATLGHSSVATTGRYLHARPTESSARFLAA
jgi:integrase/recombinase XerD